MFQMRASLLLAQYSDHDKTKGYEVRSNLKNFTVEEDKSLYCVQFQLVSASRLCDTVAEVASVMTSDSVVCVLCTSKAVRRGEERCRGSGVSGAVTTWRMMLEPQCSGKWRQLVQMRQCQCKESHSFVFA